MKSDQVATKTSDALSGYRCLNADQRDALAHMSSRRIGAIWTTRGWVWPEDIRRDGTAAIAALYAIAKNDEFGGVMTVVAQQESGR